MIHQFEVDGVSALFTPTAGPTRAGLAFRVGAADETLPRAGITHLLEHLALPPLALDGRHRDGAVSAEHTTFDTSGSNEHVVAYVNGICLALTDLPLDRMPVEKDRLRAEAAGRPMPVGERMALWRHGALDHGVAGHPETGLAAITADDLRAWSAHYFTRGNAVLWVSGREMPAGFRLSLPPGRRRPCPEPSSALPVTPAWFAAPGNTVAWSTVVPHGPAATVLAGLLDRSMTRELPGATTSMGHIGQDKTTIIGYAETTPESREPLLGAMIDVLAAFGAGRIDHDDLAATVRQELEPDLPARALDLLSGRPAVESCAGVTADDVVAVARKAYAAGLLMVPEGGNAQWAGYVTAPLWSPTTVSGTAYQVLGRRNARLITATDGVSIVAGERALTVRFDACSLYRAWPDGARQLVGHDAVIVHIEPALYRDGARAIAELDARIPARLRVDEPPRDPEIVPVVRLRDRLPRIERFHLPIA